MAVKIIKGGLTYSPGSAVPNEHKQRVLDALGKPDTQPTIRLADLAAKAGLTLKETRAALKVLKPRDVIVVLPEQEILEGNPSAAQAAAFGAALRKTSQGEQHDPPEDDDSEYDRQL